MVKPHTDTGNDTFRWARVAGAHFRRDVGGLARERPQVCRGVVEVRGDSTSHNLHTILEMH